MPCRELFPSGSLVRLRTQNSRNRLQWPPARTHATSVCPSLFLPHGPCNHPPDTRNFKDSHSPTCRKKHRVFTLDFHSHRLRLGEQVQVIRATGLGIGTGHVESAEGVCADHGSSALTVDVQVSYVEFTD